MYFLTVSFCFLRSVLLTQTYTSSHSKYIKDLFLKIKQDGSASVAQVSIIFCKKGMELLLSYCNCFIYFKFDIALRHILCTLQFMFVTLLFSARSRKKSRDSF